MMRDDLLSLWKMVDIPTTILCLALIMSVIILAKWHKDDSAFDFRQALLDPVTKVISFSRLGHFVCLIASTSLLMHEAAKGRLTDWLYIGYMTAWAGTYVASKAIDSKGDKPSADKPKVVVED